MEHLGRPLPNAVLLGAFTAVTDVLGIEAVCAAIADRFPGSVGERNLAAARAAHTVVAEKMVRKLAEVNETKEATGAA